MNSPRTLILTVIVLTAALSAVPTHAGLYYWTVGGGINTS